MHLLITSGRFVDLNHFVIEIISIIKHVTAVSENERKYLGSKCSILIVILNKLCELQAVLASYKQYV